jgi:potassium-transporting ATPase KdpC subunit
MRDFIRALLVFVVLSLLTGLIYPFVITGISRFAFPDQARGSLLVREGKTVGSALIGQKFTGPGYLYGRPSAIDYDAGNSGGTNAGPSNRTFLNDVRLRIDAVRRVDHLDPGIPVPADLVLSSASGLDPHISIEAALLQVARVAQERGLPELTVRNVVRGRVEAPLLGFIGQRRVNVLFVNLDLDRLGSRPLRTK